MTCDSGAVGDDDSGDKVSDEEGSSEATMSLEGWRGLVREIAESEEPLLARADIFRSLVCGCNSQFGRFGKLVSEHI